MKKLSRDPGAEIKRLLRQEVNYGCPVRYPDGNGCGSPILTFHHFDPPWEGNHVHNPGGMIALCPEHHHQADGGLWTKDQLQDFKRNPFVDDALRVRWPWAPETLVMKVGPSLVIGSGSPIRLDGRPVMKFSPRLIKGLGKQTIIFDSEIRNADNRRWLRVQDGWFDLRLEGTTDVVFTPQTRTVIAKHDDETFIALRFMKYRLEEFEIWIRSFLKEEVARGIRRTLEMKGAIDSDGFVSVVNVEGKFRTDKVLLDINRDRMHFKSLLPHMLEEFDWNSHIVDDKHRAILKIAGAAEFFSLG